MPRDSHRWSADDIINEYPQLGIPHFQRGLVWGEESVSLLLESLYFETPCGELVLWRPRHPEKEGIPLQASIAPHYLIIDGQQRIRSVWSALAPEANPVDLDIENGAETNGCEICCINLCKVPELRKYFDEDDFPLFRLVRNPLDLRAKVRYKHNLIPLACFLKDQPLEEYFGLLKVRKDEDPRIVQGEIEGLRPRIQKLRTRRVFSITRLVERDGQYMLSDVVALYNRINSGGMRVESEEKAFATLVSLAPRTSIWLGDIFKRIHPEKGESPDRDSVLKRQKERSFGFKLFIRTFVQVCAYHFGYSVGSSSFSFNVVEGTEFRKNLKDSKQSGEIFKQTERILLYIRRQLEELHCDDLRTLPETTAFFPVFQLLIRYPSLMDDAAASPIVRSLILRLFLLPVKDQRATLSLVSLINKTQTVDRCLSEICKVLPLGADFGNAQLIERLGDSQSLQDRYVLMLYWLVRRKGAHDFSYRNLTEEKRSQMLRRYNPEAPIDHRVEPQKQHIVPYSMLRDVYGITGRGRLAYHPINDIGNLTYISAALNDYETGLGADPVRLEYEPRANLEEHFLAGEDADNLRELYQSVVAPDGTEAVSRRESYEKFCKARRKSIALGFADWLREETPSWILARRITPAKRLFYSFDDDLIRELKYPAELEDVLLARVEDPKFRLRMKGHKESKEQSLLVSRRGNSKGVVLELKRCRNAVEIMSKDPTMIACMSRLAGAGSLKMISETQWHLRVDSARPAAAARVLSTLLDEVLGAKS